MQSVSICQVGDDNLKELQEKIDILTDEIKTRQDTLKEQQKNNEINDENDENAIEKEQQAKRIEDLLQEELKKESSEYFLSKQMHSRTQAMEPPLIKKLDDLTLKKDAYINDLKMRRAERIIIAQVFFDNEGVFCFSTLAAITGIRDDLKGIRNIREERLIAIKPYYDRADDVVIDIENDRTTVEEHDLLQLPLGAARNSLRILDILTKSKC